VLLSFFFLIKSQGGNPNDLRCDNVAVSASLWQSKFPTNYAFNGFFKADGKMTFFDPTGTALFTVPLDNSIWHQYFANNGYLVGDLFLSGAPFGYPGIVLLTSRQVSNPMFSENKVCQNFLPPSPANLIASYSELEAHGVGFLESRYLSLDIATYKQIFSNEFFSFDNNLQTAFSETNNFVLGIGNNNHYIANTVSFRYTPISEAQANVLGYNANVASFNSTKGIISGKGSIPLEILTAEQRLRVDLKK
jgi:hypothetical protein